jgi:hypothetical protein
VTPVSCCDGVFATTTIQGRTVWQTNGANSYMYFAIPASLQAGAGQPVYAAVQYYDSGYAKIGYQYDNAASAFSSAEVTAHSSVTNSGTWQTSYFQMLAPSLTKAEGGGLADFRISSGGATISIASVTLSKQAFPDPTFQMALTKPWLTPVMGGADSSTLAGKAMAGYQGWFRCPNDLNDIGWSHWDDNNATPFTMQELYTSPGVTSQWPNVSYYPASSQIGTDCPADQVVTASGKQGYVFSSANPDVVQQHFAWMQQYNVDGIFLQRFLGANQTPGAAPEWVLANIRKSAASTGRIWAIEYDVTGLTDANIVSTIESDWRWLHDSCHILQDTNYAHNAGKPVVFIWGLSLRPDISTASAQTLINFFKSDPTYGGNYVIGGIGNNWPSLLSTWQSTYQMFNGLLVWQPQNNANDHSTFASWGVDWYPHIWADHTTPGTGYWSNLYNASAAGADRLFIGMFDEYNEGTAISPMSDDPPVSSPPFETNQGKSPFWWLQLTSEGKAMMLKQTPLTPTMPSS